MPTPNLPDNRQPDEDIPPPRPSSQPPSSVTIRFHAGHPGYLTSGIAGAVAALAFFAMPYVSVLVLSATGAQLAGSGLGPSGLLWVVPLGAVGAIAISCWGLFGNPPNAAAAKNATVGLLLAGGAPALVLIIGLVKGLHAASSILTNSTMIPNTNPISLIGTGFWATLLSAGAIVVGGAIEFRQTIVSARPGSTLDRPAGRQLPADPTSGSPSTRAPQTPPLTGAASPEAQPAARPSQTPRSFSPPTALRIPRIAQVDSRLATRISWIAAVLALVLIAGIWVGVHLQRGLGAQGPSAPQLPAAEASEPGLDTSATIDPAQSPATDTIQSANPAELALSASVVASATAPDGVDASNNPVS
jgi:hypothetical protein